MEQEKSASIAIILLTAATVLVMSQTLQQPQASATFISDGEELTSLTLEVAETEDERRQGLMNRTELEENHGMIFIYPDEDVRTFWMKNTYIPLDMIFIDRNRTIVDIQEAEPEPNTPGEELERYASSAPAMYVIETNQGFSEENGIEPGDQVKIELG